MTPMRRLLGRVLALPLWVAVAVYLLLSDLVAPALRPVLDAVARLRLIGRLQAWRGTLRPYGALVSLGVPAGVIEVLKLGAVYWAAKGHIVSGAVALLALPATSLLATERLFTVVKPHLLTIPWFAALWVPVEAIRDILLRWMSGTRAWAVARTGLHRLRGAVGSAAAWVRTEVRRLAGRPR